MNNTYYTRNELRAMFKSNELEALKCARLIFKKEKKIGCYLLNEMQKLGITKEFLETPDPFNMSLVERDIREGCVYYDKNGVPITRDYTTKKSKSKILVGLGVLIAIIGVLISL